MAMVKMILSIPAKAMAVHKARLADAVRWGTGPAMQALWRRKVKNLTQAAQEAAQQQAAAALPYLYVVAAALVDADGRILVQQRPEGTPMAGLWEFPGGKLEVGETPEAALIRELREELGIEVEQACLAPACFASEPLGSKHLLLLLYVCRKWKGTPTAHHASAMQWVRPVELHGLEMPPADKPLIGLLEAML